MPEIINTYLLNDPKTEVPMNRDDFYAEQISEFKKTGQPTRANEIIDVFIFNTSGELLVQKRSYDKFHNPGLLDKSIGGHVRYGDTADYTVMVETVQELQTPSIVLKNKADYNKTMVLLKDYLTTIAIIQHSHTNIYHLEKIINKEKVIIANKVHAYIGLYEGSVRPVDREAKGILFYRLEELDQEMASAPQTFTSDFHVLLKALRPEMDKFIAVLKK